MALKYLVNMGAATAADIRRSVPYHWHVAGRVRVEAWGAGWERGIPARVWGKGCLGLACVL